MTERAAIPWKNDDWFCDGVLSGSLPVEIVHENAHALAFRAPDGHRNKKYEVHAIVIPKRHIETILDLDEAEVEVSSAIVDAIRGAARALSLEDQGFFVRANVLPPYQGTGHAHLHLLSGKRKKKGQRAAG